MTRLKGHGRSDDEGDHGDVHGMMDDQYWSTFSSDSAHYELGPVIGFGASAIVYSAVYRPPPAISPDQKSTTEPSSSTTTPTSSSRSLEADIVGSQNHSGLGVHSLPDVQIGERECAIKVSSQHSDVELLFKESRLLSLCRHANVLRDEAHCSILAAFTLPPDHRRIAFVTPLIPGGSLAGILDWRSRLADTPKDVHTSKFHLPRLHSHGHDRGHDGQALPRGVLSEEEIKAVVRQVLEGLQYLHARGYIHRDVKAGNLLVEADGTILLADFGVGGDTNAPLTPTERGRPGVEDMRFVAPVPVTATGATGHRMQAEGPRRRKSFVGTPNWMAPEVILGQGYDAKADIWSLGMTILELAYGEVPGSKDKQSKVLKRAVTDPAPTLDRTLGGFSKDMKLFVDACLVKDPEARVSAATLLEHHWLKGARKNAWLADMLLADVPPVDARQELRRVPSVASMFSQASSWNFDVSPSLPSSPTRSTIHAQLPVPVRSPSTFSQFTAQYNDDFPAATRSHSRTSSRMPSVPPSPRIPLRQWAERTASPHPQDDSWSRSASERGDRRRASMPLRRGQSMSFDQVPMSGRSNSPATGSGHVRSSTGSRARRLPSVDGAMSPLVEASLGVGSAADAKPFTLGSTMGYTSISTASSALDLSALRIRTPPAETQGQGLNGRLSTSSDEVDMDLRRLDGLLAGAAGGGVGMVRGLTGSSDTTQIAEEALKPTKQPRDPDYGSGRSRTEGYGHYEPVSPISGGTASPSSVSQRAEGSAEMTRQSSAQSERDDLRRREPTVVEKGSGGRSRTGGWLHRRRHEGEAKVGKHEPSSEQHGKKGGLGRLTGKFGRLVS